MKLSASKHSGAISRDKSQNMVLAQVGWLGFSGTVYPLTNADPGPTSEPGGFSPLYLQLGSWEEIEPGAWRIKD